MCLSDSNSTPHEEFDCDQTSKPEDEEKCNAISCVSTSTGELIVGFKLF